MDDAPKIDSEALAAARDIVRWFDPNWPEYTTRIQEIITAAYAPRFAALERIRTVASRIHTGGWCMTTKETQELALALAALDKVEKKYAAIHS